MDFVSRETMHESVFSDSSENAALARFCELYPSLLALDNPELVAAWAGGAAFMQLPKGAQLFAPGQGCKGFPLLLEGEARVYRMAPSGRQLEMYRLSPGEICLVSSASLFGHGPMSAYGDTSVPSALWLLPPATFERWLAGAAAFRDLVLAQYAARMADLTELIDALAFHRLDQRLAQALLGRGPELVVTHQQLADQLGTAREIVTRLLRRFEEAGWVGVAREHIAIIQPAALRKVAEGQAVD